MAATTITRESMTDGVTAWNVARIGSAVYDRIDALIGANITFGGLLNAEGYGQHTWSSGGAGLHSLDIRNTTSGTGAIAGLRIGNNSAVNIGQALAFSSAYTTVGQYRASGLTVECQGAGGLNLSAASTGALRLYTADTERVSISSAGAISLVSATTFQLAPLLAPNATALSAPGGVVTLPGTQGYIELTAANFVDADIVGIGSGVAGKVVVVSNVDSGHTYTLYHEAASATAADRFFLPGDADVTLAYGEAVTLVYSATISRWVACLG